LNILEQKAFAFLILKFIELGLSFSFLKLMRLSDNSNLY
jgi:hypothetical protein